MDLPVFDLSNADESSPEIVSAWLAAATGIGAFGIVGHGVADSVLQAGLSAARRFHTGDIAVKDSCSITLSAGNRGYVPADPTPRPGRPGTVVRDYASMDIGPESSTDPTRLESILLGANRWPQDLEFRAAVADYATAIRACAGRVSRMLSLACGLKADHIENRSADGIWLLRLLHYPYPAAQAPMTPTDGHTDYEWFTLVWQSSEGLELLGRDGLVYAVPARPDMLVVLIGDLLEVLSGGAMESTLHWVRATAPDRYSLTYFHGPDFDQTVAPAAASEVEADAPWRYPELHAGHHLTALRVRHFAHLREAVAAGRLRLPFELPAVNPLKAAKTAKLDRVIQVQEPVR